MVFSSRLTVAVQACAIQRRFNPPSPWPRQLDAYGETPDIVDMAAAYTTGIVRNHPFIDGNKRTGFILGVLFLELNGYRFTAAEESAAQAVMALAAGTLDEAAFSAWFRAHAIRR